MAAISVIKNLFAGQLAFDVDPGLARILTDTRRGDLVVAGLICTAERRNEITSTDSSRVEYTKKLFLYTWGTSPAPGPEDVQAWTVSHPYSHVTADPTPSVSPTTFAAEKFDVTDPSADICTQHTIPAGVAVCVQLRGTPAAGVYAVEAKDHGLALTSIHSAQSVTWFKQNIDYAVCVRPTPEVGADGSSHSHIGLEFDSRPHQECLAQDGNATPGPTN